MPARELEVEIAATIVVEGERVAVRCTTICLDHQASCRPMEVHLVARHEAVDHRSRQVGRAHELEEATLKLAASDRWLAGELPQEAA